MGISAIAPRSSSKDAPAFAARLDEALTAQGIPRGRHRVSTVANKFNVTQETARQWTMGRMPGITMLCKVAVRLNVSLDWLATGRGSRQIHNVAETAADYAVVIERELVDRVRKLSGRRKKALFELLDPEL